MSKPDEEVVRLDGGDVGEEHIIETCQLCNELILDAIHDCQEELDEQNYSDRLQKGFDMLDMED